MIDFERPRIKWYRTPINRTDMKALMQPSDILGMLQAGGFLALAFLFLGLALWLQLRQIWWALPLAALLYGGVMNFSPAAVHELSHNTMFSSKRLNGFFAVIMDVLSLNSQELFWASHKEHHRYTLHFPDDMEAIQPQDFRWMDLVRGGIINFSPRPTVIRIRNLWSRAFGPLSDEWHLHILPEKKTKVRRSIRRMARITLAFHVSILVVGLLSGVWILPVLITGYAQFGSCLMGLCSVPQHIGLAEKGNDFRTNSRTLILNPLFRFLYWHMNYHIEHHMYPAVPCYRLGQLHRLIQHDLPPTPKGLVPAYREINAILKKQKQDPAYRHLPVLPASAGLAQR